jgi:hypothetical protein
MNRTGASVSVGFFCMTWSVVVLGASAERPGTGPHAARASAQETPGSAAQRPSVSFLGLQAPLPAGWIEQRPESVMRLAQFLVPGKSGAGNARAVVDYFGPRQGGSVKANIERWQSQFRAPGSGPVQPASKRASSTA